jgi:hypothetical protein
MDTYGTIIFSPIKKLTLMFVSFWILTIFTEFRSALFYLFPDGAFCDTKPVGKSFASFIFMMHFQKAPITIGAEQRLNFRKDFLAHMVLPAFPLAL